MSLLMRKSVFVSLNAPLCSENHAFKSVLDHLLVQRLTSRNEEREKKWLFLTISNSQIFKNRHTFHVLVFCDSIALLFVLHYRVMTRKQQLRHYNLEKAEEVVAAKNAQKEELVKAVKSFISLLLG